ncbi:RIC1-domain-containing protein [Cristinia sonorae]|uniref:RIC1-domain-containing protein n=1 Tax=Cristinia sonorae TaxID=1940300 RepID=A0A8K0UPI7_9AGAR|nr:RIC1-domain-containing protein [Cristinia sonorae]
MYFPTSAARRLSSAPPLPGTQSTVIGVQPNLRKTLFCALTANSISLWRVRPSAVLAYLSRTPTSISAHGNNLTAEWSPDGQRIVIQTTDSYLVLVSVEYNSDETVYASPPLTPSAQRHFLPGPGEALPLQSISLRFDGVIRVEGQLLSVSPREQYILYSTKSPPALQRIPWPVLIEEDGPDSAHVALKHYDTWLLNDHEFPWLVDSDVTVNKISYSRQTGGETWLTSDGRAYFVQLLEESDIPPSASDLSAVDGGGHSDTQVPINHQREDSQDSIQTLEWRGICVHDIEVPRWVQKRRYVPADDPEAEQHAYHEPRRAKCVAVNTKFSLVAAGTQGGTVEYANLPSQAGVTPKPRTLHIPNLYNREKTGQVLTMEWSSDGYVLAVGWEHGWAVFSVGGRCLAWSFGVEYEVDETKFQDAFMYGIRDLFWAPGNFELVVLARPSATTTDGQLFVIPFAKSATTGQHTPDNTQYAFLEMDDRVMVYRGADQPDMSVINPESDVWQRIKIPQSYLATNWPIKYSALSADGRLVAVAGRRGLAHYSSTSGRWKLFADYLQEQGFTVRGGLVWFHHILIAAVEVSKTYQIRLYSRDLELSNQNVIHREILSSPVVIMSLVDNSLLVYTADNTLYHYLIKPIEDSIELLACGSINFDGVILSPTAVRVLSWMIPSAQKLYGDPREDLSVATVLMIVGGKLVLLKPRKSKDVEVKYDMQILADRIEFCWIHLNGIGTLENSLWGYDGQGIRVWLNALNIESIPQGDPDETEDVKESVNIPLDFYPLSVLMDKGIIIGVEHEAATRMSLSFVMFRHITSTHLFIHHILRFHLENDQCKEAVRFASHYQHLVFFSHSLEILLHSVVEDDASASHKEPNGAILADDLQGILATTVEFLDHFDASLDIVVGCARKIEMNRWPRLFDVVGSPQSLFETCLSSGRLKTAASYLLVLHNLEQLEDGHGDVVRLLREAIEVKDWQLCRELLRFLHSIDETGAALRDALRETNLLGLPDNVRPL